MSFLWRLTLLGYILISRTCGLGARTELIFGVHGKQGTFFRLAIKKKSVDRLNFRTTFVDNIPK